MRPEKCLIANIGAAGGDIENKRNFGYNQSAN